MLLLNLVRVLITLVGLIIADAFRTAYELEGIPLLGLLTLILFVVFVVGDFAEDALVAHFNKEEEADASA